MVQAASEGDRTFRPRPFKRSFADTARHWFGGNAVATHLVNSINLLFPEGERFFVRSVRRYEERIQDPALRAQIKAFYAQEGRHAGAHERYFGAMREQGYEFEEILTAVRWLLHPPQDRVKLPLSARMRLSITVALEHYTAIMAELMFTDEFFARIEPPMRELLLWHAAEEIEHKAVAFDVLAKIDPRYGLRMGGFVIATIGLMIMWAVGTAKLLRQDGIPAKRVLADLREVLDHRILGKKIFWQAFVTYLPRDFHPLQHDNFALVKEYLERFEAEIAA